MVLNKKKTRPAILIFRRGDLYLSHNPWVFKKINTQSKSCSNITIAANTPTQRLIKEEKKHIPDFQNFILVFKTQKTPIYMAMI